MATKIDWAKDRDRQRGRSAAERYAHFITASSVVLVSWWQGNGTQAEHDGKSSVAAAVLCAWQRQPCTLGRDGTLRRRINGRVRCFKIVAFGERLSAEGWRAMKKQLQERKEVR
jgi:hypothetical protein